MRPVTSHEPPQTSAAPTPAAASHDSLPAAAPGAAAQPADEGVPGEAPAPGEAPGPTGRLGSDAGIPTPEAPIHEAAPASEPPADEALANDASPREVPMSEVPAGEAPVLAPSSAEPGTPLAGEARPPHETAPEPAAPPLSEQSIPEEPIPEASIAAGETETSIEAMRAAELAEFVEPPATGSAAGTAEPAERPHPGGEAVSEPAPTLASEHARAPLADMQSVPPPPGAPVPESTGVSPEEEAAFPASAELSARDAEHLAERLRVRFAGYLREEGRGVIEARCRDALAEHTSWLVRQVTREVTLALEGEVAGWVRDAVREELAAHRIVKR
nr:DUF2486 family protein [Trinickia caryophylli]